VSKGIKLDAPSVVRLPEGIYLGRIIHLDRAPAPWAPRKLDDWEILAGRQKRKDWHAYYHVELHRGEAAQHHRQLEAWAAERGRLPVVSFPCHYTTPANSSKPLPLRSTASNLMNLLMMTRPGTSMVGEDNPFEQPVGWWVRVRCGRKLERDWTKERDPIPEWRRGLVVRKVLEALSPESNQSAVNSALQSVASEQRHSAQVCVLFRADIKPAHDGQALPVASPVTSSSHGIGECAGSQATAAVEADPNEGPSTAAGDGTRPAGYVPPPPVCRESRAARIRRLGPEAVERGRCEHCGRPKIVRPHENAWCIECEWQSR
jgi:hypothetical protein